MPNRVRRARVPLRVTAGFPLLAAVTACTLVGLVLTAAISYSTIQGERHDAATETNTRLVTIGDAIERQVSRYAETLYGLRTDFAREPALTRQGFRQLVDINALKRRNPGAESVTFNRFVPDADLRDFVARVRRDVPDFAVYPRDPGTDHVVVEYIEPPGTGSIAMGLDIYAEKVRRAAVTFARDSGELSATEPLALVQEPTGPGFLLMLAAYDVSPVPLTAPARSRHFLGVLVAVFTARTMIEQATQSRPDLPVSIYDAGPTVATPRARPRSSDWVVGTGTKEYSNFADIDVGSRRWRIVTDKPVPTNRSSALATATGGTALTLLVVGSLAAIALGRRRAVILADRMTLDLRASKDRLYAANESLRGFIDVAAHDLRSPLVSIAGFSALLNDDEVTLSEEEQRRAIGAIDRQARHMGRLIDDLLTLSSIDGGLRTSPAPVVLASAIAESLESQGELAASITVDCPPDLVGLVDPDHLRRILDNYMQNAAKYGAAPITVSACRNGSEIEVRVADQGAGVPEEFVPRLFGKFARAETADTRAQRGTGLGLSIVRGLAEANGGRAFYEPNRPHGSCFVVRFPAAARD